MKRNPLERLGAGAEGAKEIKNHPFFADISWDDVINKRLTPPFKRRKVVRREDIPLADYVEAIGQNDDNRHEGWSFIR